MKLFFLEADKPIVKKYIKSDKGIDKEPYPMVYEFTSHEENITSIEEFRDKLELHGRTGRCLLKGVLSKEKQLKGASRAGATSPDMPTTWICLDLDGVDNYQSVDLFLQDIGLGGVDYILQWSSGMGIENQSGFRCHVFMLLDQPIHPQLLKHYLVYKNLSCNALSSQLQLTKTGNSLRFPLDISTCQNDKLIYIAPPILVGLADPYQQGRIKLQKGASKLANISLSIPNKDNLRLLVDKKINDLREKQNLPKKRATKYNFINGTEYMANPEQAIITGQKTERGFVYLNLNGGDSWAYYHPEDNPYFIYNFKGEPFYRTQDLLPEYWSSLASNTGKSSKPNTGRNYLAFRDFYTGTYYNAIYNTSNDELSFAVARNETQLRHFMEQHGQPLGEFIPDWNVIYDPDNKLTVDLANKILNVYKPSAYMRRDPDRNITKPPAQIHKLVSHVLGGDAATIDSFYNWLAVIVKYKDRTGTAWVLHGTQGTGKGLLYHKVLTPILGIHNVATRRMEELESQFTDFMENRFLVFIDEIETGNTLYHNKVIAKLKNLIVEPSISIRKLYQGSFESKNRSNMIFASNKSTPVEVAPDDRRFNVGPYQAQRFYITEKELEELDKELSEFYSFLMNYPADKTKARYPHINEARNLLIDINRKSIDVVCDALLTGNLEFLIDQCLDKNNQNLVNPIIALKYIPYRDLIQRIVQDPNNLNKLSREELWIIFEWCVGDISSNPGKFTAILKHHRIHLKPIWKEKTVRGIEINWKIKDDEWLTKVREQL